MGVAGGRGKLKVSPQAKTFVKAMTAMDIQAVWEIALKQLGDPVSTPHLFKKAADNKELRA
jgi:hypothetical protein